MEYGGWKPIDGLALWPVQPEIPAPVVTRRLGRRVSLTNDTSALETPATQVKEKNYRKGLENSIILSPFSKVTLTLLCHI